METEFIKNNDNQETIKKNQERIKNELRTIKKH